MAHGVAGKRIILGVSGSIAAFKVAGWASTLAKEGARVSVIMTESSQQFISPLTFAALTGESPFTSMFADDLDHAMSHIELAQEGDIFLVAPASAQTISRLAHGMADDLLSTAVLAAKVPVIVCPAMNTNMYLHPATQKNLQILKEFGYIIIDPVSGLMACKDEGPGRLAEWESVEEVLVKHLVDNDLTGERVLVTAGPTREPIDPARFISNRSSGKMGYAIARTAYRRGADVVLISGPTTLPCPFGVKRIEITTAQEMYDAVMEEYDTSTIIVKSAAVSDFRPRVYHDQKVKKENAEAAIGVTRNTDILYELGRRKNSASPLLVGFAAESQNILAEGRKKLEKKNLDLIVINKITSPDTGFESDTNRVTLLDNTTTQELPLTTKMRTADMIWDYISHTHINR